jgi:hypothetical protein
MIDVSDDFFSEIRIALGTHRFGTYRLGMHCLGMYRLGMHRLGTNRTLEEACEEERLPREEELLMESVEAESSFS